MTGKFDLRDTKVWADLQAQSKAGRKRCALITDIDDTLYRADHDGAVKAAWDLRDKATNTPYPIIAVTGGDYEQLVRARLESKELPILDVLVTSVGTEIRYPMPDNSYEKDEEYDRLLKASGYDRLAILGKLQAVLTDLRQAGNEIDFQEPQAEAVYLKKPDPSYLPYKVSLHFFADDDGRSIAQVFKQAFPALKIVVAEEIHHNATLAPDQTYKKYCLDIMPATKADAVNYLIKKLALDQGVVAGDSGNDIDMLLETPKSFVAVAVGGHKDELKAALHAHKVANKDHKQIFIDTDDNRMAAQTLLLFDGYLRGEAKDIESVLR